MTTTVLAREALLRPIVFSPPFRVVHPSSWITHIPFAFWLVDALRPRSFVELGTMSGNSYSAFAQAVQVLGLETACYAVDTWVGDPHTGAYGEDVFAEWSAFHDQHFGAFSRLVRSTFDEARDKFQNGSIDLLHIDGFHTYEAVRHDFETWLPKLSASAVVLLHDVNVREGDFGVWRFWEELSVRYPCFRFLHGHGLGVVGVGRSLPLDVRLLVEEVSRQTDETVIVRQFFATLGAAVRLPQEAATDTQQETLRREIQQIAAQLAQRDQDLAATRAELAARSQLPPGLPLELEQAKIDLARARKEREAAGEQLKQAQETASRLEERNEWLESREAELTRAREAQRRRRRDAQLRGDVEAERWKRLALRPTTSRAARVLASIANAKTLAREAARRVRFWRPVAPGTTPLLSSLAPGVRQEVQRIRTSGLFDEHFYLRRYPEIAEAGLDPLLHFVIIGGRERRAPHPLFDPAWYVAQLPADDGTFNPLLHYLDRGWREGRSPHALFDVAFYLRQAPSLPTEGTEPLGHYLRIGAAQGLDPHPLFDTSFYLAHNQDVAISGANPLLHYHLYGWSEGRNPHPLFDSGYYVSLYDDVDESGINPLVHFVRDGAREARNPNPWFDTPTYLAEDPELRASGENPLLHFLRVGARELRSAGPRFNTAYYARANPDAGTDGMDPLSHYVLVGRPEGRSPTPPPALPDAGNLEWSASEYESLTQAARDAERARLGALSPLPPDLIRLPDGADFPEYAAHVRLLAEPQPEVSIVIPVLNGLKLTIECLLSIATHTSDVSFEVIVVDNGSTDGTHALLSTIPNLTCVRQETNTGFVRACNGGAAAARGRYLVLLNNDAQVTAGWLSALLKTFSTVNHVGAVGPKVLYPSGHLQEAGVAINADCSSRLIGLGDDPTLPRFNCIREVDYLSGVCLAIETERFRALQGFSDDFAPAYCEDVDLCLRLRREGLRAIYQPSSVVVHHLSATSREIGASFKHAAVTRNQQLLSETYQTDIDALDRTRVIAFYLPQYHPIPENDVWWGKGFTEWRNVTRARPNFEGHYQPRLSSDLGFYDLRVQEAYLEQVALARRYGVDGFCIYYYWFHGKRLLERPLERLIEDADNTFPFCLCWANENWTRRWDGLEHEVLMAQEYTDEDAKAVIADLLRYLRHRSYIRVNGRPLLLIYHASRFPDIVKTTNLWRNECRALGVGEIYLVMVEAFELSQSRVAPADWGFDAAVEFPPHHGGLFPAEPGRLLNPKFTGRLFDYTKTALYYMTRTIPGFRRFRTVMPGWDNTPRRQDDPVIFTGTTPGAYQAWLEYVVQQTREQNFGDEQLVFINAWNEWAEGTYLEPDLAWGHAFLEATRDARDNVRLRLHEPKS